MTDKKDEKWLDEKMTQATDLGEVRFDLYRLSDTFFCLLEAPDIAQDKTDMQMRLRISWRIFDCLP